MAIIKAARIKGFQVSVCGVSELGEYANQGVTHLISISDGHMADNENFRQFVVGAYPKTATHFAFFNDLFTPSSGNNPPTMGAVRTLLDFSAGLRAGDYCLVHCAMGISRSSAVAYATLCHHAGPGLESACLTALERIRPCVCPNPLIVHFCDDLLRRHGAMIQTAKEHAERRKNALHADPSLSA